MSPVQLRLDAVMWKKRQRNKHELSNTADPSAFSGVVMAPVIMRLLSCPFKKETPN